jgi:uncharacterized protein YuzE
MYPSVEYDEHNDIAYITFSENKVAKSIESDDELLVFDIDSEENLVGVEIMSLKRLKTRSEIPNDCHFKFYPELIPFYRSVFQLI